MEPGVGPSTRSVRPQHLEGPLRKSERLPWQRPMCAEIVPAHGGWTAHITTALEQLSTRTRSVKKGASGDRQEALDD